MKSVLKSYAELVKFRLSSTVVATSVFGYILALKYSYGTLLPKIIIYILYRGI
jgi:heme O synthase-like polyprenyltransferase